MWRILVAGGGPAGLYVCRNLVGLPFKLYIDLYEKSSSLYGLLRTGVAPDKLSLKALIPFFDSTISNPKINVKLDQCVGSSITVFEIAKNYDFFILTTGATVPRNFTIPGESGRVFQALDFCNYYNNCNTKNVKAIAQFLNNTNATRATVLGYKLAFIKYPHFKKSFSNGNVALDIAKMLLYPRKFLENACISKHVLNSLPQMERVYVVGRKGLINAKFTNAELRSIIDSDLFHPIISPCDYKKSLDLELDQLHKNGAKNRSMDRRARVMEQMVNNYHTAGERIIEFISFSNIEKIIDDDRGMEIQLSKQGSELINIASDIVLKALGFERDQLTMDLLSPENAELFKSHRCHLATVGWARSGARGNLSTTILQAKECSDFVKNVMHASKPKSPL